jgi:hypothetical protein
MSRHHGRVRLAALAASVGATVAVAALGSAGTAMASVTCASPGFGSGSSLQNNAQQSLWLPAGAWGAHTECSSFPSITYTGTSSGGGLNEFGNVSGALNPEEDSTAFKSTTGIKDKAGAVLDWYAGTDDPPTSGNLASAIVASGDKNGNFEEITLPVAQAPVAVMLSLPAECLVPSGSSVEIDGKTLVQLWEGTTPAEPANNDPGGIAAQGSYAAGTWGALLTQLGYSSTVTNPPTEAGTFFDGGGAHGCGQAITLQVRSSYSGTTYAFKNYLNLDDNDLFYSKTSKQFATQNTWTGYISDAPVWPATVSTVGNGKGSQEVQDTAKAPGSVGYANTSDAVGAANGGFTNKVAASTFGGSESHQIVYANIQNNVGLVTKDEVEKIAPPAKTYADPVQTGTEIGNCETDKLLAGDKSPPYSFTDSWYGISAEDPNVGVDDTSANYYPACALTYDLVWKHYNAGGLYKEPAAGEIANSVKDLFKYITGEAGQAAIKADYYTAVPSASLWKSHIKLGVEAITG